MSVAGKYLIIYTCCFTDRNKITTWFSQLSVVVQSIYIRILPNVTESNALWFCCWRNNCSNIYTWTWYLATAAGVLIRTKCNDYIEDLLFSSRFLHLSSSLSVFMHSPPSHIFMVSVSSFFSLLRCFCSSLYSSLHFCISYITSMAHKAPANTHETVCNPYPLVVEP